MSQADSLVDSFPQRPVAVKASRLHLGVWLGLLVGIFALGLAAFTCAVTMPRIALDSAVFETGTEVEVVSAEPSFLQYTPLPYADCTVFFEYRNRAGEIVEEAAEAQFLFAPEWGGEPTAKIDGLGNVALSIFAADVRERWVAASLFVGLLLALAFLVLWVVKRQLRTALLWRELAANPEPTLANVEKWAFEPDAAEGSGYRCHFSWQHRGSKHTAHQFFACVSPYKEKMSVNDPALLRYDEPLWSSAERKQALALVSRSGEALLVPRSFKPLILTPEEKSRLLAVAVMD